jgi:hypothetical protein
VLVLGEQLIQQDLQPLSCDAGHVLLQHRDPPAVKVCAPVAGSFSISESNRSYA